MIKKVLGRAKCDDEALLASHSCTKRSLLSFAMGKSTMEEMLF